MHDEAVHEWATRNFGIFTAMLGPLVALMLLQQQSSQDQAFNPLVVDRRHINVCDTYLNAVEGAEGTQAYRRILFISEALTAAEVGAKEGRESVKRMSSAKNYTDMWTEALAGETTWKDHMLCAAQVMAQYTAVDDTNDPEAATTTLLIAAFNEEAHSRALLAASQRRRFIREGEPSKEEQFADAEELHKITAEQDDAADSIRKVTMLAAAQATDLNGPNKAKVTRLLLTCREQAQIDGLLKPLSTDTQSLFGSAALEMLRILSGLSCR